MLPEFKNEATLDFSKESNRTKQAQAIELVHRQLGREHDLIIGSQRLKGSSKFSSINPSKKSEVLGIFQEATAAQAAQATEVANEAFQSWKRIPAQERADVLFRAANLLRKRRFENNAWMILEVGKSWAEADADTAEDGSHPIDD